MLTPCSLTSSLITDMIKVQKFDNFKKKTIKLLGVVA